MENLVYFYHSAKVKHADARVRNPKSAKAWDMFHFGLMQVEQNQWNLNVFPGAGVFNLHCVIQRL
jgi:hypothetical protein